MVKHSALDTLIELATNQTEEAARRLGTAIKQCADNEQRLAMLLQYRDEYETRLRQGMTAGISASGYRNFQLFLEKLDAAIRGQEQIVQTARHRITAERGAWQSSERTRVSYDTLAARAQQTALARQNKQDQKLTDELATRATTYKR
ncbi:MAG TPA: flagellar export protein FliJ [Noviherbaspirillum sp.]|nr:flagellar export protein FliJ [Noviherbaspirillum sp.]